MLLHSQSRVSSVDCLRDQVSNVRLQHQRKPAGFNGAKVRLLRYMYTMWLGLPDHLKFFQGHFVFQEMR